MLSADVEKGSSFPNHPTPASEIWKEIITLCRGAGGKFVDERISLTVAESQTLVRSYLHVISKIDNADPSDRDWVTTSIRSYALRRVDELISAGTISQDRVEELRKESEAMASVIESDDAVEQPVPDKDGANNDTASCPTFDGVWEESQGPGAAE